MANEQGYTIATGAEQTNGVRLLALKAGLKLETKGMSLSRGQSAYARIKQEFGLKGNKQKVLEQFEQILRERGILIDAPIDTSAERVYAKDIQAMGNGFASVNAQLHDAGEILLAFAEGGKTRIDAIKAIIKGVQDTLNETELWFQQGKGNTGHIYNKRNNHVAWVTFNR